MTKKDRLFHQKTKKNDLILLIILLLICAVSGAGYYFTHRTPALRAEVSIDGEIVQVLDLSRDQEVTIQGARYGTNHLVVKNGARIKSVYIRANNLWTAIPSPVCRI